MIYKLLFKRFGENQNTELSPIKEYVEETDAELLVETRNCCVSAFNDMLVECNLYDVRDVEIPDWLTVDEYLHGRVSKCSIQLFMQFYPNLIQKFGRNAFKLSVLPYEYEVALDKFCKTKTFKSEFRKSLFEQVKAWVEMDEPEYKNPLSYKQWNAIMRY
jgi:hypothetical protein